MAMKLYLTRGNLIQMKLRIFFFIYSKQQQQQTFYSQIHLKPTKKRKEKKEISFFCVYCVK